MCLLICWPVCDERKAVAKSVENWRSNPIESVICLLFTLRGRLVFTLPKLFVCKMKEVFVCQQEDSALPILRKRCIEVVFCLLSGFWWWIEEWAHPKRENFFDVRAEFPFVAFDKNTESGVSCLTYFLVGFVDQDATEMVQEKGQQACKLFWVCS